MNSRNEDPPRGQTDASLLAERRNTDIELGKSVKIADEDADQVLRIARERADRLLEAARAAADARLPLNEQTEAAVALLLEQRDDEDRTVAAERQRADELMGRERRERRDKLEELLVLERQTTDLHLALERRWADNAVSTRDEFFAQASHDLRQLMAAQKIHLSLMVKGASDDYGRRLAPHLAALLKIDAQMDRMVGDLVDLVALDAGKAEVTLNPYSANELISTVTAVFAAPASERGQSLLVTPSAPDVRVLADGPRAVQVLGNLLSNAIKFTPRGGAIRVGFEITDGEVSFFVADTGPGVPAEHAARIFERFVTASSSARGLGLGLFIAARLIEAHEGRLWLDRNTTEGSVFRFTLRRAP